jgi:hypothetical protein
MCAVEKTIPSVGCALSGVLVVGQAQGDEANLVVSGQYIPENAIGERLRLDHAGNHHYANSGVQRTDVLHELLHGLPAVHHRINQQYGFPPLQVLVLELLGLFSMDASIIGISNGQRNNSSADLQHGER